MIKRLALFALLVATFTVLFFGRNYLFSLPSKKFFSPLADKVGIGTSAKFVENPLNGVMVPESEKYLVLERRPLVVMIGNNSDARPPWNISKADIVYEVVAEGGITRFMAVFLSNDPEKIGPVRSIRSYFLNWIVELGDAMVMHDGWSSSPVLEASAIDLIDQIPVRSLFRGGLYGERDPSREAPNNEYVSASVAREHGDELGWQGTREFERWRFKNDGKVYDSYPPASKMNIVFWSPGDYDSYFEYDPAQNLYLKSTGGEKHVDGITGVQLSAKSVIVQFVKETPVNDEKNHLLYANIGSGKAMVFLDGKVVEATWLKKDRHARTLFYDLNGREIEFNRGVIWVAVVPDRNVDQVTFN